MMKVFNLLIGARHGLSQKKQMINIVAVFFRYFNHMRLI